MITKPKELREVIIRSLKLADRERIPRTALEKLLQKEYSEQDIIRTLQQLQDEYVIELVIDNRVVDHLREEDETIWYVKLLSSKEREQLQSLSPVKRALLRILQQTEGENIGKMSVEEGRALLRGRGFGEEETEWLSVEDWIDRPEMLISGHYTRCYRLVPESERTEEYKREKEAQDLEWIRMDVDRQASFDRADAEAERRTHRRKKKK